MNSYHAMGGGSCRGSGHTATAHQATRPRGVNRRHKGHRRDLPTRRGDHDDAQRFGLGGRRRSELLLLADHSRHRSYPVFRHHADLIQSLAESMRTVVLVRKQVKRVGGDRRSVGDCSGSDHVFHVSLREPALAHILLLVLPRVLAGFESFGDEYGTGLTAHPFGWVKMAKTVDA